MKKYHMKLLMTFPSQMCSCLFCTSEIQPRERKQAQSRSRSRSRRNLFPEIQKKRYHTHKTLIIFNILSIYVYIYIFIKSNKFPQMESGCRCRRCVYDVQNSGNIPISGCNTTQLVTDNENICTYLRLGHQHLSLVLALQKERCVVFRRHAPF